MRLVMSAALSAVLIAGPAVATAAPPEAAAPSRGTVVPAQSGWEPRPEDYATTVVERDLTIPTSDGTELLADLERPVGTDGQAVTTPLPVVVPCHRVLRTDGSLGGYLGGLEAKTTLLALERAA